VGRNSGYLPHYDPSRETQFVTFRLSDSLPQVLLRKFEQESQGVSIERRDSEKYKRIEKAMDSAMGACHLAMKQ